MCCPQVGFWEICRFPPFDSRVGSLEVSETCARPQSLKSTGFLQQSAALRLNIRWRQRPSFRAVLRFREDYSGDGIVVGDCIHATVAQLRNGGPRGFTDLARWT